MSDPAALIGLAAMLRALTVEARDLELAEAGRRRLLEIHQDAVEELKGVISRDVEDERTDLGLPLEDTDATVVGDCMGRGLPCRRDLRPMSW